MNPPKPFQSVFSLIATITAMCTAQITFAQNVYHVGVPVCDTLGTEVNIEHAALGGCAPYDFLWFRLTPSVIPYVTGLEVQIVITETIGQIWSGQSDTLKARDILPVPALPDSGVKVFLTPLSSFKFITRIVGVPTVPNEGYYCEINQGMTARVCANQWTYYGEGQICQVQPAVSVETEGENVPVYCKLLQNYPNPFNAATAFAFDLRRPGEVTLKVMDLKGREIAAVITKKTFTVGRHHVVWSPRDLAGGIYVYLLTISAGESAAGKVVLLK